MKITAELQLRRLTYSSANGASVVFGIHEEEWEKLKGAEGARFMAVLVEVGNDEQPVGYKLSPTATDDKLSPVGPLCKLACIWCKDERFWEWLRENYIFPTVKSEETCKTLMLEQLGIETRKSIDNIPSVADKFNELFRIPFMKWLEENYDNSNRTS